MVPGGNSLGEVNTSGGVQSESYLHGSLMSCPLFILITYEPNTSGIKGEVNILSVNVLQFQDVVLTS